VIVYLLVQICKIIIHVSIFLSDKIKYIIFLIRQMIKLK
jgi:hypothetical protein